MFWRLTKTIRRIAKNRYKFIEIFNKSSSCTICELLFNCKEDFLIQKKLFNLCGSFRSQHLSLAAIFSVIKLLGDSTAVESLALFKPHESHTMDLPIMDELDDKKDVIRLIVNACGKSTLLLFQLINDESADVKRNEIMTTGITLWQNLMEHLNRTNNLDCLLLALTNIEQLAEMILNVSKTYLFI